jgi:hypothetical protein
MDKKEYKKAYKQYYKKIKKIVTVPLDTEEFIKLETYAKSRDLSTNKLSKEILSNFVNSKEDVIITKEQQQTISEYIHISRGIANNINQIAYKSNLGEYVDINMLLSKLKENEDKFKEVMSKINL